MSLGSFHYSMAKEFIDINPATLSWARSQAGFERPEIAKRIGVKVDRIEEWEAGRNVPTVRQANLLAEHYGVSLFTFLDEHPPVQDHSHTRFRTFHGSGPHVGRQHHIRKVIRHLKRQNALASDLESFDRQCTAEDRGRLIAGIEGNLADRIRTSLEIRTGEFRNVDHSFRDIRRRIESFGILVVKTYYVDREVFRGVSVLGGRYPAIAINNKEYSTESMLYTLLHELVHILQHAGNAGDAASTMDAMNESAVERIAGDVLLPVTDLDKLFRVATPRKLLNDVDHLRSISRIWGLTPKGLMTRLLAHGIITRDTYDHWLRGWNDRNAGLHPRKAAGRPHPVYLALNRNSGVVIRRVVRAYHRRALSLTDALAAIDVRANYFDELVENVHRER